MEAGAQLLGKRYELLESRGKGGMGVVYKALDRLTGHIVALKRVTRLQDLPDDESQSSAREIRLAIAREFKTLASLRHPHIIHVLDYGFDEEGVPFFTMELLSEPREFLEAARNAAPDRQLELLTQLLQALAYLHRRNVLHRDLKPANVLVDKDGHVKIVDFGLATGTDDIGDIQELAGTLNYMAPELFTDNPVSRASDLYAFGILAYELMTGFHPFEEYLAEPAALMDAMLHLMPQLSPVMAWEQIFLNQGVSPSSGSVSGAAPHAQQITRVWSMDTLVISTADLPQARAPQVVPSEEVSAREGGKSRLARVIGRLLEKTPEYRYQDAYQVLIDFVHSVNRPVPHEPAAVRDSFLQAATFVGRQRELTLLTGALQAMLSGGPASGSAWLVGGESGVGKTRLVDELRTSALVQGVTVLHGQAAAEGDISYQLWREPLRRLLLTVEIDDVDASILQDVVSDIARLLRRSIPPAPDVEETAYRQRLTGVIASLFQRQAHPVLLLIEDLQWSAGSLDVLQVLKDITGAVPLMIVGTYRSDERPELPELLAGIVTLKLERLSDDAMVELTVSMLGEAGKDRAVQEFLRRETEGNAYFLVEVVRALAEEAGSLTNVGRAGLPKTVLAGGIARLVERRLSRVPEADRALLALAAVAGREVELNLLSAVVQEGLYAPVQDTVLDNWLTTCLNVGVLEVQDGRWRFSHDKLRQSMLKVIDADTLPLLHRAVARAIELTHADAADRYAVLMRHWQHAGDVSRELHYATLAGDFALQVGLFDEAIARFTRALELIHFSPSASISQSLTTLRLRRAEALENQGNYAAALEDLEYGLAVSRTENLRTSLAYGLSVYADVAWRQGDYARAAELCQASLVECQEQGDMRGMARALNRLGVVAVEQGDYATSAQHLQASLTLARQSGYQSILASVTNNLGLIAFAGGNYDDAARYFKETLEIARQGGERRKIAMSLLNLGTIAGERQKNYQAATRYLKDALDMFREIGEQRGVGLALRNLGGIAEYDRDYLTAIAYYEQSLQIYRGLGERQAIAQTLAKLANVMRLRGSDSAALQRYVESLQLAHEIDATPIILEAVGGMASLLTDKSEALLWLGLVMNHPAAPDSIRSELAPVLEALKSAVTPDAARAAFNAGKSSDLKTIVVDILNRFSMLTTL